MAVTSMEEQLRDLYQEKEILSSVFPGLEVKNIIELARSVQGQLDVLVQDQIDVLVGERRRLAEAFPGMSIDQIIEYARKGMGSNAYGAATDPLAESMELQLKSLYAEKEELEAAFPGKQATEIVAEIQGKIRLLEQFYAKS